MQLRIEAEESVGGITSATRCIFCGDMPQSMSDELILSVESFIVSKLRGEK